MVSSAILLVRARDGALAGARTTGDWGGDQPLAFMPVLNKSLIAHTVDAVAAMGVKEAALVVEERLAVALTEALKQADARGIITGLVGWDREMCVLKSVSKAREQISEGPFLLHLGDSLTRRPLAEQLGRDWQISDRDAVALMSRFNAPSEVPRMSRTTTGRRADTGAAGLGVYDAGLYLLGSDFPDALAGHDERRITSQIAAGLDLLQEEGGEIARRYVTDWWCFRGQAEPMLEMNRFALTGLEEGACEAQLKDADVQGAVLAPSSAVIESSVIRGPVVIGANARIKEAFVGPYSSIGAGVSIEGAEVEHSVILDGASISHLGERLESSVIGPGARIFRDFRLPRALRLNVGPGANIALQ